MIGEMVPAEEPRWRVDGRPSRTSSSPGARVGIRENRAYIHVYSEYWDGNHFLFENIFIDNDLSDAPDNVTITQGKNYKLTIAWDEPTATLTFKILDIEATTEFEKQVIVPGPISPPDNPHRFIGVSSWIMLDNTSPTFNWNEVSSNVSAGKYFIWFEVSDGILSDQQDIIIEIK